MCCLLWALCAQVALEYAPPLCGVGATLNVEKMVTLAHRVRMLTRTELDHRALSRADVLVCSRGGRGMLRERMTVIQLLWSAGIATEAVPASCPSLQEQYDYAQTRGMRFLVTLHSDAFSTSSLVKVRLRATSNVQQSQEQSASNPSCYRAGF